MLILLWGLPTEDPLAMVRDTLEHMGAPVVFADQNAVLQTEVELEVARELRGSLSVNGQKWDLDWFTAVYTRAYDSTRVASVGCTERDSPERRHASRVDELLWTWCDLTACCVVNRPRAMGSNDSKPLQLDLIRQFGFATPETIVTTDPNTVRAFWEEHKTVVYKSISGVRSIVRRLGPEHESRLEQVVHCPTQFQAYIPGLDVRAHIVGDEVLACELESAADDYRYPGTNPVKARPCVLPADVTQRCIAITAGLGLSVAGIDLRRTPEGEWFCFEVNPMPGFSYFEHVSGQPIAASIARLLMRGPTRPAAAALDLVGCLR